MLSSIGPYAAATAASADLIESIVTLGVLVPIATFFVSWHLPADPRKLGRRSS